jgi:hypothetical protein
MSSRVFSEEDLRAMSAREIDPAEALRQLDIFRRGVAPSRLLRPARVEEGIVQITQDERKALISLHDRAAGQGRMLKFVPASGAASRMFTEWQSCCRRKSFDSGGSENFLRELSRFAFYDDLKEVMARNGQDVDHYMRDQRSIDILEYILTPSGLNYASLPKALLKFHSYTDHNRTAMEEHLVEAASYVRDNRNICRVHFTVSEEHEAPFLERLGPAKSHYERLLGVSYDIAVTIQHPSTDTIAVDMENRPFRDGSGKIVFRPGGHGALLQNLNAIDGDIIFLKNIDNIVPDRLKDITVLHKKVLGGYLVQLQEEIFESLSLLSEKSLSEGQTSRIIRFCQEKLFISFPDGFSNDSASSKKEYLISKLNRPLRICGMVKNEGEPGGGPFWVEEKGGSGSLQIVEQHQVDPHSEDQKKIWRSSTHFNPVDLVCGVRNHRGEKFDLNLYADRNSGSISQKRHEEGDLKALELPGLWNGSMAFWNTVLVEVPLETFNPVKTIDDLLRKSHLPY